MDNIFEGRDFEMDLGNGIASDATMTFDPLFGDNGLGDNGLGLGDTSNFGSTMMDGTNMPNVSTIPGLRSIIAKWLLS